MQVDRKKNIVHITTEYYLALKRNKNVQCRDAERNKADEGVTNTTWFKLLEVLEIVKLKADLVVYVYKNNS